ncbi:hypothetical protein ABZ726_19855, partial [Streptomyces hundungensis]|uniref:hypothetical protein n=1 Tax=Streptomyces hundungensis TaxID=1077946 RepID=UPI0033EF1139
QCGLFNAGTLYHLKEFVMSGEFTLPPPGLSEAGGMNLGPILDPPFSDAPDFRAYVQSVTTTPVTVQETESVIDEAGSRTAAELALQSEDVSRELAGRRYEVICVGSEAIDRDTHYPLVIIFDYTENVAVEARVDIDAGRVLEVRRRRYQPQLSVTEERRAIELVRQDGRLAAHETDLESGAGILVEDVDFRSPRYGHRLVDLRFGPKTKRLPTAFAIVDLTDPGVVRAGPVPSADGGAS